MGKRWDAFVKKWELMPDDQSAQDFNDPDQVAKQPEAAPEPRFEIKRAYTAEPLSTGDRADLAEVKELPGYDVIRGIMERTAEGFVSTLVKTDPSDEKKVLAYHKLVYAAWRFYESVQAQVDFEVSINEAARNEQKELDSLLKGRKMPDLNDPDTLGRLLDPTYIPPDREEIQPEVKSKKESPLDVMLKEQ